MNRGINKVADNSGSIKGKQTKAESLRIIILITEEMEKQLNEISEAMSLERAAATRMLINFALRFASPFDITSPKIEVYFSKKGAETVQLSTRITQEMFDKIEEIVKIEQSNKSAITKRMLAWALDNVGFYTIEEWVSG